MKPAKNIFKFKQFEVLQAQSGMKIGTDGVLLGAWVDLHNAKHILDIGTGTGLIALMCAQRHKTARITAVEIDESAAVEAAYNFTKSPWADRLKIVKTDFKQFISNNKFDIIISNPPFFDEKVLSIKHQRNLARNAENLPLQTLLAKAKEMLTIDGTINLILPVSKLEILEKNLKNEQLYLQKICFVKGRKDVPAKRILVQIGQKNIPIEKAELIIEIDRHVYTEKYKTLTGDFYL